MAVERVVAGVDDGAGEPAAIDALVAGSNIFLAGSIQSISCAASAQKPSGSAERARVDLVIAALALNVHCRAPIPSPFAACADLYHGTTRALASDMDGQDQTQPCGWAPLLPHCHGNGAPDSSWKRPTARRRCTLTYKGEGKKRLPFHCVQDAAAAHDLLQIVAAPAEPRVAGLGEEFALGRRRSAVRG